MEILQKSNEYEDGKRKPEEFRKMPFAEFEQVKAFFDCKIHGKVLTDALKRNGEIIGLCCPKCEEKRRLEEEKEAKERQRLALIGEYKRMNVAPEFYNKTFDDYKPVTENQKEFLKATKEFLNGNEIEKLVVLGNNGTGKSMLGNIAVKEKGGLIYTMFEISLIIRSLKSGGEREFVESLIETPLLVVDEVGRSKGSEFELNLMSYVLDKRHAMRKKFIILSNTHFSRSCPNGKNGCDMCFERYFDNDLLSRFRQRGKFIEIEGNAPDWRDPRNEKREAK